MAVVTRLVAILIVLCLTASSFAEAQEIDGKGLTCGGGKPWEGEAWHWVFENGTVHHINVAEDSPPKIESWNAGKYRASVGFISWQFYWSWTLNRRTLELMQNSRPISICKVTTVEGIRAILQSEVDELLESMKDNKF